MDKKGYTTSRIVSWTLEFVSMLVFVVSLFFDGKLMFPSVQWQWVAIWAGLVFILTALQHIIRIEGDLFSRVPKITIARRPYIEKIRMTSGKPIIVSPKGETAREGISNFVKVAFANTPKNNNENNHAKRVTARITYLDQKRHVLVGPIYARWSNSSQPRSRDDIKSLIYQELDSGGKPEPIDLAYKIESEPFCYAYNNDSYFMPDFKCPEFELRESIINIEVKLTGERVNRTYKYMIFNDGKDTPIRLA